MFACVCIACNAGPTLCGPWPWPVRPAQERDHALQNLALTQEILGEKESILEQIQQEKAAVAQAAYASYRALINIQAPGGDGDDAVSASDGRGK